MYFQLSHKKNSTITTQVMCAIVFCLFSFIWLYWTQVDVLTVAQHAFSNGQTHYDRTVGAILITLVLQLMQKVVFRFAKLDKHAHALTYVPSMLMLALICKYTPEMSVSYPWISTLLLVVIVLLVWSASLWMAHQMLPFVSEKGNTGVFSRRNWVNMLTMAGMMLMVAGVSNTNAVFQFRSHAELAIGQGDYKEALRTGSRSNETDVSLTMLRAYALSKENLLGEKLFEYPIEGRGQDLLPLPGSKSRLLILPKDSLYFHLGARPIGIHSMKRYLDLLEKDSLATHAVADYRLCALLIDKKISAFVHYLPQYYDLNEYLPKVYREALTLYVHSTQHPVIEFSHEVMNEDWKNFQALVRAVQSKKEKDARLYELYASSYWYYYFYK